MNIIESKKKIKESKSLTIVIKVDENQDIFLTDIIEALREKGFYFQDCIILCTNMKETFITSCSSEKANQCLLPATELNGELKIERKQIKVDNRNQRMKERNIKEVIEKVAEWRRLYLGISQKNGVIKKYTLEEAADIVGIPKKTLDDYLLQIVSGRKYGFDFNLNCEAKVGLLRSYVKLHRKKNMR